MAVAQSTATRSEHVQVGAATNRGESTLARSADRDRNPTLHIMMCIERFYRLRMRGLSLDRCQRQVGHNGATSGWEYLYCVVSGLVPISLRSEPVEYHAFNHLSGHSASARLSARKELDRKARDSRLPRDVLILGQFTTLLVAFI